MWAAHLLMAQTWKRVGKIGQKLYTWSIQQQAASRRCFHLPIVGFSTEGLHCAAGAGRTSLKKLQLIRDHLPRPCKLLVDIGSNTGYFSLVLAREVDFVIGLEPDRELVSVAQLVACRQKTDNVAFASLSVGPETVQALPEADVYLVLSVLHNWARKHGWRTSLEILQQLWARTKRMLFFELPNPLENPKVQSYLPDFGRTDEEVCTALQAVLSRLPDSNVTFLAQLPTDFRGGRECRPFFLVCRVA